MSARRPASMADPESHLVASAVSGQTPPAGPPWMSGLEPLESHALGYDKPLGRTRPDPAGREALLRYVSHPPLVQEHLEQCPDDLVRIWADERTPLPDQR